MMRAYVAIAEGSYDVLGFYYLLTTSVEHDKLGPNGGSEQFIDLDRIPAMYLGMLAVHQELTNKGIGTALMVHALKRTIEAAKIAGLWAMTLDAIDEAVVPFYERFDFKRFLSGGREMYLPLGTIRMALEEQL